MCHNRIYQSALHMSGTWMYHHILGFIHYQKPFILIQDIQSNVLRLNVRSLHIRHLKHDLIACLRLIVCPDRLPIYRNHLFFQKLLKV